MPLIDDNRLAVTREPMIPRAAQAAGSDRLVELDLDHPGVRDAEYRRRRDDIARLALEPRADDPCPVVPYTEQEHTVWRTVWRQLSPLLDTWAAKEVLEGAEAANLDRRCVPQLRDVNVLLEGSGFRLLPVAGLVEGSVFLTHLGRGVFLSTQYMRHHSRPLYTPEPDVIHELIGHAMTLVHPAFAEMNRWFGVALARTDDPDEILGLLRVYWYTLEFGAVREADGPRAIGAGLLSSAGELRRFAQQSELRALDLQEAATLPFDPAGYQPVIFVADSFAALRDALRAFLLG